MMRYEVMNEQERTEAILSHEMAKSMYVFTEYSDEQVNYRELERFVRDVQAGEYGQGEAVVKVDRNNHFEPSMTRIMPVLYDSPVGLDKRLQNIKTTLDDLLVRDAGNVLSVDENKSLFQARQDGEIGFALQGDASESYISVAAMMAEYTAIELRDVEYTESDYDAVLYGISERLFEYGWTEEQLGGIFPDTYWSQVKDSEQMRSILDKCEIWRDMDK